MRKAKKLIGILLTLAMVLSMSSVVFADTSDSYTITVDPAYSGETYTAYKVFDATYTGSGEDLKVAYTIDSTSPWFSFIQEYGSSVYKLTQINDTTTYLVTVYEDKGEDDVAEVFSNVTEEFLNGVNKAASEIASIVGTEETGSGTTTVTLDVTSSGAGYYYVTTSLGTVISVDSATPNVTISDKNTPPDVDKKVDEKTTESTENHKTVEYELDIDHVAGNVNVILHDKMDVSSEQVTYTFDYDNMTVTLIDNGTDTPLIKGTDYVLITEEDENHLEDGCAFEVDLTGYDFSSCSAEAYIEVKIDCELDAVGAEFGDDEFKIPNYAQVTYGNSGYSVWKEADVYEYGFEVYKYDGEDETPLADAHFTMTNSSGQTAYFLKEDGNMYLLEGWVEDVDDIPEGYTADLVSDEKGMIYIEGLGEATYTITETQAPDGYNMLTNPITVTITADENDPSQFTITVDGEEIEGHVVNIENNAGSILPGTGGMGTTIFYVIGVILVLGAAILLITKRRMSNAQ